MAVAKSVRSVRRLIAAMANRSPVSSGTLTRPSSRVSCMPTRDTVGRQEQQRLENPLRAAARGQLRGEREEHGRQQQRRSGLEIAHRIAELHQQCEAREQAQELPGARHPLAARQEGDAEPLREETEELAPQNQEEVLVGSNACAGRGVVGLGVGRSVSQAHQGQLAGHRDDHGDHQQPPQIGTVARDPGLHRLCRRRPTVAQHQHAADQHGPAGHRAPELRRQAQVELRIEEDRERNT